MADIYASAAVTIIAAAGEDPSHGLPGVRRTTRGLTRVEQVRSIRLFVNPPIRPMTVTLLSMFTNQNGPAVHGNSSNATIRRGGYSLRQNESR